MGNNSNLESLELQLKKNDLSFEERMEIKDKILEIKVETGTQSKGAYHQIKCIGCSG